MRCPSNIVEKAENMKKEAGPLSIAGKALPGLDVAFGVGKGFGTVKNLTKVPEYLKKGLKINQLGKIKGFL